MGIVFNGAANKVRLGLTFEHPAFFHLNMGNAAALLGLLDLLTPPNDSQYGSCTLPEARRAVLQARARFTRKASGFTREGSDTQKPGKARVIRHGLDEDGLASRLDAFEEFVNTMDRMGAERITWA